ncbi:hypothetical protein PoB_000569200 [Plakobranchus ocellatus]|uniref:Uncharacterized protein n=1 Tax=Plakobranchus ocellatus TaxID=259542 RepID=A0AAV3Y8S6_9GAST|nr:hypothetical protein PoB_000569200 [Plakobranchus ocellatus]
MSFYARSSNSSNSNSNFRLNYLYPCGESEDYGRKLYIFPSGPSPAHTSTASLVIHPSVRYGNWSLRQIRSSAPGDVTKN